MVYPDSELIPSVDGQSQVANYIWEVVENPLQHVLQFDATRNDAPSVSIQTAVCMDTEGASFLVASN